MRKIKIPTIRLDKTNVDAPTINRALDNIINNVNTLASDTANAIDDIVVQQNPVNINAGGGISVVESPTNTFTITNTQPGVVQQLFAGNGISVVQSPAGTFTITNTLPENTDILAGTGVSVVESPPGTFTISASGSGGSCGPTSYIQADFSQSIQFSIDTETEIPSWQVPFSNNMSATAADISTTDPGIYLLQVEGVPRVVSNDFGSAYWMRWRIKDGNTTLDQFDVGREIFGDSGELNVKHAYPFSRTILANLTSSSTISLSCQLYHYTGAPVNAAYTFAWTTQESPQVDVAVAQPIHLVMTKVVCGGGGSVNNIVAGTGIGVVESPAGTFTIDNTGALLSGPAQTFTNQNTFVQDTTHIGRVFFVNNTFINPGTTMNNQGSIIGGIVNAATYQNLPVQSLIAGTNITLSNAGGNWTINAFGGVAPAGAKASANFDPTPLAGAVQQTGNVMTISMTGNDMAVGDHFWLKDNTGTINEYCQVASVITSTLFTAISPVSRNTGTIACTRTIWVRAEYNIASVEALVSPGTQAGWFNQVYRIFFTNDLGTDRYYPMCSSNLATTYNNQWAASIGPAYFYTPAPINSGAIWIGSPNTLPYRNVSLICY